MFKSIKIAALSAVVGLASLAAVPAAQADGFYFSIGQGHVRVWDGPRHHPRVAWRACTPRHAVRKAERYGLRRAHVVRANRNIIKVRGHRHHQRVNMVFARAPGCPVIR